MNWSNYLTNFGRKMLEYLGEFPSYLPSDHNPITEALKNDPFLIDQLDREEPWFDKRTCRIKLSRVATVCQMVVYDAEGGPDGERQPKALRRSWYAWYKVDFAQPLSKQLGEDEFDGTNWAGRMSSTYAEFVDDNGVTYRDLWVTDASRMIKKFWDRLFQEAHIVFAVEKDSLFDDMKAPAAAMGARSLVSGKGKMSKAATEKVLRDHFSWSPEFDPFTAKDPLYVIHLSDHDYDGEEVIGPTFADQARRYTPHVREARIGIKPEHVDKKEWEEKWYEVKTSNSAYVEWAEDKALFEFDCLRCGNQWLGVGYTDYCPQCDSMNVVYIKGSRDSYPPGSGRDPHGFEVEALPTRSYYGMAVDALLQIMDWEYIIERLREECTADPEQAASRVAKKIYGNNEDYQALMKEFDRLERIKEEFERQVQDSLHEEAVPHISDWEDLEEDPEQSDYRGYVSRSQPWYSVWRPFNRHLRTEKLVEWLEENVSEMINEFSNQRINW